MCSLQMNSYIFIPARIDSSRLFQKMIKTFPDGSSVISRTVNNAKRTGLPVHLIADSDLILESVELKNENKHIEKRGNSGTERIGFFLEKKTSFKDEDLGVIVLGDQPEIDPNLINFVVEMYMSNKSKFDGVTVHVRKNNRENFVGTNNCKMILGKDNKVYYISRSPIPGYKDKNDILTQQCVHDQHVSVVAIKVEWIRKYPKLEHFNSLRESNEWLPFILNNCSIKSYDITNKNFIHLQDVNTYDDWEFYEKKYM